MKTVKKYNVIIPFRHGEHEFLKTKEFSSDMVTFTEDDYKFLISRGNIVEIENQKEEKKLEKHLFLKKKIEFYELYDKEHQNFIS